MSDLKMHQSSITITEQISNLQNIGLIVNDIEYAEEILNDISYFRLIKAYSLTLKSKNGKYKDSITFEHLVDLYKFDANFRQLLFPEIEKIEINIRCRVANYFADKYGVLGYKDSNNFENARFHADFMEDITKEINRNSKSPFVKNFLNNYVDGDLPIYALVELFSFGTLSKFFKNMKSEDKKAISKTFNTGYTYFESWIESIAYVRNICAHYGRLYNAKLSKTPILYKQYTHNNIGNIRIFGVLLCMKHLLDNDTHWNIYVDTLEALFDKYDDINKQTMGFPENWYELLINKKD